MSCQTLNCHILLASTYPQYNPSEAWSNGDIRKWSLPVFPGPSRMLVASNNLGWKCMRQIIKQMNTLLCYLEQWGNPCNSRAKRCFYQLMSVQSLEELVSSQAKKENVNLILNLCIEERYFWKLCTFCSNIALLQQRAVQCFNSSENQSANTWGKNRILKKE